MSVANWTPWTREEKLLARQCVIANLPALNCLDQFPGRSESSVVSRFNAIRIELGMRTPGDGRVRRLKPGPTPRPVPSVDPLLKRQLETGQHFIRDRAAFVQACASVGIVGLAA